MNKRGRLRGKRDRVEKIQVYLSASVDLERVLLDLWNACKVHDHPQHVFRRMLLIGAAALTDAGELSSSILAEVPGLADLPRPVRAAAPVATVYPTRTAIMPPPAIETRPAVPVPVATPARQPVPQTSPEVKKKPDPMALVGLMGGPRTQSATP